MYAKSLLWIALALCAAACGSSKPVATASGKQIIFTDRAPKPSAPYSQAVIKGKTLYLAGQIALDPASGNLVNQSIEAETKQVLENIKAVLAAAGFTLDDVMTATVYLTDIRDFQAMNGIFGQYFAKQPPARTTVQVAALPRAARIEIAVIAEKD